MQWSDAPPFIWMLLVITAVAILVVVAQARRSKALGQRFGLLAQELGWSDVRFRSFLTISVQGMWNGYAVKVRRAPQQKGVPERVISTMGVQAPARMAITRRQRGILSGRPFAIFGPPLVDLPSSTQFWICSDEITLAERLMMSSAAAMLDRNLHTRHDFFRMGGDALRIQRASERDPDGVARIAREEMELLRAVADALALRP